jgi:periplasmic protein TonB
MFETVAPEKFAPRSRKLFYETLPVSIALHALAGLAIAATTLWSVEFPDQSPPLMALYSLTSAPTPPPPPPPPPAAKRVVTQQVKQIVKMPDVAPTFIPEEIPTVVATSSEPVQDIGPVAEGVEGGIEGGVEGGVVGGEIGGVEGGSVGGVVGGTVGATLAPPDTVVVKRDAPLPMAPMSMVFPKYPDEARIRGREDVVVVRYIIGKNGRVREVIVLDHPEHAEFETVTVKAIRNWRFKPHKVNGVAQEVIHELTVFFKLNA